MVVFISVLYLDFCVHIVFWPPIGAFKPPKLSGLKLPICFAHSFVARNSGIQSSPRNLISASHGTRVAYLGLEDALPGWLMRGGQVGWYCVLTELSWVVGQGSQFLSVHTFPWAA